MHDIFLSYSRRDSALAERIGRELEKLGRSVFVESRDILPGQNWRDVWRTAIKDADMALVLISSPHSAASSWMGYEVGAAEALGKPILTLVSDRLSASDLPDDLISGPIVSFDPQSPERAAREVVERLAAA
jgi:hypothetical protein